MSEQISSELGFAIRVWADEQPGPDPHEPPDVQFDKATLDAISLHAREGAASEVGGILLGHMAATSNHVHLVVMASLRAEAVRSSRIFVQFTHETWARLRKARHRDYPGLRVVGWYHSHPGFGLFLSNMDREFHSLAFGSRAWQVALVVDPSDNAIAVYWPSPDGVQRANMTVCPAITKQ
jgi:proteasome lid subunit RPN8/RPN11